MLLKCHFCLTTENLKMCSRCHSVAYCTADHQKRDWKDHKVNCKPSFHSYDRPLTVSEYISQKQMIEIIGGPIQGDFYQRDRENIRGTIYKYAKNEKKCVISKDLIFLPLGLPELEKE